MAMDWAGPSISASSVVLGGLQLLAVTGGTLVLYRCVDLPSERWRHAILEKRQALCPFRNFHSPVAFWRFAAW